jgi:hypothetical protein
MTPHRTTVATPPSSPASTVDGTAGCRDARSSAAAYVRHGAHRHGTSDAQVPGGQDVGPPELVDEEHLGRHGLTPVPDVGAATAASSSRPSRPSVSRAPDRCRSARSTTDAALARDRPRACSHSAPSAATAGLDPAAGPGPDPVEQDQRDGGRDLLGDGRAAPERRTGSSLRRPPAAGRRDPGDRARRRPPGTTVPAGRAPRRPRRGRLRAWSWRASPAIRPTAVDCGPQHRGDRGARHRSNDWRSPGCEPVPDARFRPTLPTQRPLPDVASRADDHPSPGREAPR